MQLKGSCLCGSVRFECSAKPNWVCHCHCESCRKNCAAPFTTFFGMDNDKFRYGGNQPGKYVSSKGVCRFFCNECGTPIAYYNPKWSHETHFYVAALENPELVKPQFHVHWSETVAWANITDDLPKYAAGSEDGEPL